MKRNFIRALLAVALAGLLSSGCGRADPPNELHLVPEEQDKIVINLFTSIESSETSSASLYRDLIADYNAQSGDVEIRVSGLSTADGYNEALKNRLDNGKDVDLFIVNADTVKALNAKGYFYDLSDQPVFRS